METALSDGYAGMWRIGRTLDSMIDDEARWREWYRLAAEMLAASTAVTVTVVSVPVVRCGGDVPAHAKAAAIESPFADYDLGEEGPPVTHRLVTPDQMVFATNSGPILTERWFGGQRQEVPEPPTE